MHMPDSLISPIVGGTMWAASSGIAAYSIHKVKKDLDDSKVPLMGVMGAFIFAAQMINFAIPATGSSGHIVGALLLAVLLGPFAAFLTLMSVLLVQAVFFADGGLLAFGCNAFNLGFFTCFLAYPLIYKPILRKGYNTKRIFTASILSSVLGLQLGAFSLVLETVFSGKTELPFLTFASFMQPIHLIIGIAEGLISAAIIAFVWKVRPELIDKPVLKEKAVKIPMKKVLIAFIAAAVIIGGALSWFASTNPDGLEWSIIKTIETK